MDISNKQRTATPAGCLVTTFRVSAIWAHRFVAAQFFGMTKPPLPLRALHPMALAPDMKPAEIGS